MKAMRSAVLLGTSAMALVALTSSPSAWAHDEHAHAPSPSHLSSPQEKKRAGELVRTVREATARYRDVTVAEADNYHLMFGCVSGGEWGAMGLHYVNMNLVDDDTIDPTHPEIVIYEPLPNNKRRIIGADYLVYAKAWHANNTLTPQINGQLMHLIESPNRYGLEAFYTLHVWAWKDNPNGAFVNWHPYVSCDDFEG